MAVQSVLMERPKRRSQSDPAENRDSVPITQLLRDSEQGSISARDQLLELVYAELQIMARRQMRNERHHHTLSATALVNEAYLKLFRDHGSADPWSGRAGFYAAAGKAMRRILIDHARAKATDKRGGAARDRRDRVSLDVLAAAQELNSDEILSLDRAICRLEEIDERAATVVRLRFYAGLKQDAVAGVLSVSERTVKRDWEFARAWLADALQSGG